MVSSANLQTYTTKLGIIYSDFSDNINKAPFSNDLAKVTNENSVKQSLGNIVQTVLGERLYDYTIGSSNLFGLFEIDDSLTNTLATQTLKDTIAANEPRASILQIQINNQPDSNYFIVTIFFTVLNNPNVLSTNVIIQRIR